MPKYLSERIINSHDMVSDNSIKIDVYNLINVNNIPILSIGKFIAVKMSISFLKRERNRRERNIIIQCDLRSYL